jgi:Leucine-rich repeat (LRR) protein
MIAVEPQPVPSRKRRRLQYSLRTLLAIVAVAIFLVLGSWLCVAIQQAREDAIASGAQSPLNQLQLALHNYHHMHGCFPPAYLTDAEGAPLHSWRVLILPFIEQKSLYDAYRFDEPWNGPNNVKLADRMPEIFHIRSEPASTAMTNIVAIVGPGTAFPGSRSTRIKEFADGLDNTILLAEIAASDIPWLEPRDLRVEEMSFTVNDQRKPAISSSRRRGPYVVFADSIHTYQVSPSLRPEALEALTTIAGGEKMYVAEIAGIGLTSPANGPATDEKIKQLSLDGLDSLWLSRSDVTDAALGHLAAAPRLSKLHLRSTRITDDGLRHFQQGPPLRFLDLSHTAIGDNGLRHLAGLTWREYPGIYIYLDGSRVTISGVAQFLKSLPEPVFPAETRLHVNEGYVTQEVMAFGGSTLTDAQIECFQGLTGFRQVDLSKTQITDVGLKVVASFTHLAHLDIPGTRITDRGLEHLKGLTRLQTLNLSHTEFTGSGLEHIEGLAQLGVLKLGSTQVTDSGLKKLKGSSQLHWLALNNTAVTDSALEYLKGLTHLQVLELRNTHVTDEGVKKLLQALPNCRVAR